MIPTTERIFLYRYLGRLLARGIHTRQALKYFIADTGMSGRQRQHILRLILELKQRRDLPAALVARKLIPADEYGLLRIALKQRVPDHLAYLHLALYLHKQSLLRKKIRTIMIYPVILVIEIMLISGLLLFWLVPQLQFFFDSLRLQPPDTWRFFYLWSVRLKTAVSSANWPWLMVAMAVIWLMARIISLPATRRRLISLLIRLPRIGQLYRLIQTQRIFGYADVLLKKHRPNLSETFQATSEIINHPDYRSALLEVADGLSQTKQWREVWRNKKNCRLLPAIVRRLLTLESTTGNSTNVVTDINELLTEEIELELKHFVAVLEPAMIISIALVVATIALSLQRILAEMQNAVTL